MTFSDNTASQICHKIKIKIEHHNLFSAEYIGGLLHIQLVLTDLQFLRSLDLQIYNLVLLLLTGVNCRWVNIMYSVGLLVSL